MLNAILNDVIVNCAVIGMGTAAIWKESSLWRRIVASVILSLLSFLAIEMAGMHMCREGGSPAFVVWSVTGIAATLPWIVRKNLWLLGLNIALVVTSGMHIAHSLTNSYHRDDITGNPDYSSGRFWHTPFTGQLPRDREKMKRYEQERHGPHYPPDHINSKQPGPAQPATQPADDAPAKGHPSPSTPKDDPR